MRFLANFISLLCFFWVIFAQKIAVMKENSPKIALAKYLHNAIFDQCCILLNYIIVISSKFINKFAQKWQYFTLMDQSVPLTTVTSLVCLGRNWLCFWLMRIFPRTKSRIRQGPSVSVSPKSRLWLFNCKDLNVLQHT